MKWATRSILVGRGSPFFVSWVN